MKKNIIILFLFCFTYPGFSSSIEVNYFGDIDRPFPKLTIIEGAEYDANLDFERKQGFELTVVIQEVQYNRIMDNIINFSNILLPLSKNYFVCTTTDKTYYFLDFENVLNILVSTVAIIDNQKVISHLTNYIHQVEILYIRFTPSVTQRCLGNAEVPGTMCVPLRQKECKLGTCEENLLTSASCWTFCQKAGNIRLRS
ncbi:MAG: hypothetical protein LBI94_00105 [Treponema sp.]|jgi:hypothetical protein|nr:hypothetical protein [Treponema sp.]